MERIGPGALLAGRYRLVERVHADPVAALWRSEDVTLERPAAVRVLAPGHTHVDSTLDAARRAAIVDDGRLQRVLGVGVEAGCGYVILEWIDGPGAADLAGRVGEAEARRIVREAAEAVETARTRGLRHGRLTPGHVRRTADGRIRILGLAVDAATIGRPYLSGPDAADPADLVAILYALISGHHPLGFVEGLLGAPTSGGRPVSLRELRPETSAELDELCVRTFAGTPPETAGQLAEFLRRAESDGGGASGLPTVAVVGDPLPGGAPPPRAPGLVDVRDLSGGGEAARTAVTASRLPVQPPPRHDDVPEPAPAGSAIAPDHGDTRGAEIDLRPFDGGNAVLPGGALAAGSTASASLDGRPGGAPADQPVGAPVDQLGGSSADQPVGAPEELPAGAAGGPAAGAPAPRSGRPRPAAIALRDTLAGHAASPRWRRSKGSRRSAGSTRPSGMEWSGTEWSGRGSTSVREDDDWSILPIPAEGPEDPVWQARHQDAPEWEPAPVPAMPPRVLADPVPVPATRRPDPPPYVPVHDPVHDPVPDEDLGRDGHGTRRRGLVAGVTIAALLAVVGVVAVWATTAVRDPAGVAGAEATASAGATDAAPSAAASPQPETSAPPAAPVLPVAVQPLDPLGDNAENDELVTLAIDGDPATAWQSLAYETQNFGNLKTGLGIAVNLGEVVSTSGLTITAPGDGGTFEVRSAGQPVFEGSTVIADGATSGAGPVELTWDPVETQFLIVWFTALPQNDGRWRAVVSEVAPR